MSAIGRKKTSANPPEYISSSSALVFANFVVSIMAKGGQREQTIPGIPPVNPIDRIVHIKSGEVAMNMKPLSILILILAIAGCTSMKPVAMPPDQLHERISAGDIINEGDKVKIVTTDGKTHQFTVTAVNDESIVGDAIDIPITDIVTLKTKEYSGDNTAALVGGSSVILVLISAAAATMVGVSL
jgi:hypothetical protein